MKISQVGENIMDSETEGLRGKEKLPIGSFGDSYWICPDF
jgi:hypothetical protein